MLDVAILSTDRALVASAHQAMRRAGRNLARLQGAEGSWPGDYGGPMFLLPMYVALCQATDRVEALGGEHRAGMIAYLLSVQQADGSVGLHAEATRGSMFTTALVYVALRVLGLPSCDARVARMRRWIHEHGTPLGAAAWGKFTLCLLGLYDWQGIHPILPELWLLPPSAPIHPGRLWCHCRQVYLPMAWLYAKRATGADSALLAALRDELYAGDWSRIEWSRHRDTLSDGEAYRPTTPALAAANRALSAYERIAPERLRARALDEVTHHIDFEDKVTDFIDIGPVNKVLNAFVHHFRAPGGAQFERSFQACDAYVWHGHDGIKMQGYNNSQLWDTAFAAQALLASPFASEQHAVLEGAYRYLRDNQILEDVPEAERHYRHASRGGWPFSNRRHGWPITDCTAEGLKVALLLEGRFSPSIADELLMDAVRLILSWQNHDGGWATYERQRGGAWLELLNPSQVFGDIMVDYSYVECTSACLQALCRARGRTRGTLRREIELAIARGSNFLRRKQRSDGSFEGSWGVCFSYGTWFAVSGLLSAGVPASDASVERACRFLLGKQRASGGWGEHGDSCRERSYLQAERASVTQTAWALLTLVRARHASRSAQARAARMLVSRQSPDGGWPRESMVGVFNRTCLINYDNYRHYFPLWALAEWAAVAEC